MCFFINCSDIFFFNEISTVLSTCIFEYVVDFWNLFCQKWTLLKSSLKEQYSQAVIRTNMYKISRIVHVKSGLLLCTMDRSVSGYIVQSLGKVTYQCCYCIFSCSFRFEVPVIAQYICFFWNWLGIYLFLPPTITLLVRLLYYWPAVVLLVSLCVYIAYTRGTD